MDLDLEDVFRKKKNNSLKIVFSGLVVPILNHSFNFQKDSMVNYQDFLGKKKEKEKKKEIRAVIKDISVTEFSFFHVLFSSGLRIPFLILYLKVKD